jgi:hypothetical protein
MCDSDQAADLIQTEFVTTYADKITTRADHAALEARFPRSRVLYIDRALGDPLDLATIGDFEPGALSKAQARPWVKGRLNAGKKFVTAYSDQDWLPDLITSLDGLPYWHWIADPGALTVPGHPAAAVQFMFAPPKGPHVDLSAVKNDAYWPESAGGSWTTPLIASLETASTDLADALRIVRAHQG